MQYHFHAYEKETLLQLWSSLCNIRGCRSTATDLLKGEALCYEFRKQSSFLHVRTTARGHTTDHFTASILSLAVFIFGKSMKQCLPKMLLNGNNSWFRDLLSALFSFFSLQGWGPFCPPSAAGLGLPASQPPLSELGTFPLRR